MYAFEVKKQVFCVQKVLEDWLDKVSFLEMAKSVFLLRGPNE